MKEDINWLIYEVVEESDISRAEIADACGQLYSTFQRQVNPHDPYRFPADQLVPLVKATRDRRILDFLVSETYDVLGLTLVKDRPRKVLFDDNEFSDHFELVAHYQKRLTEWRNGKISDEQMLKIIDYLRGELLAVRKAVKTRNRQPELFGKRGKK